jgi:hypothetical protein
MRFEVFTAAKVSIVVSSVLTPCILVGSYKRFGVTYRLHLHDVDWIQVAQDRDLWQALMDLRLP